MNAAHRRLPLQIVVLLAGALLACKRDAPPAQPAPAAAAAAAPAAAPAAPAAAVAAAPAPKPSADAAGAVVAPDKPAGPEAERDRALHAQAMAILDAHGNTYPALSPDGKKVVFVSSRDGLPQLYVADTARPKSPAVRLVTSKERVAGPVITPDGKSVLYRSDRGADENWSIYSVPIGGGAPVELSDGRKLQRFDPIIPDQAPQAMFYSERLMSAAASRVVRQPVAPTPKPEIVFESANTGFLVDVSRDGKRILFMRVRSASDHELSVVEVATKAAHRIYPPEGKTASVTSAFFSGDGSRVLVATDGGGELGVLLALDPATGAERARHALERPHDRIANVVFDRARTKLLAHIVAGDHDELRSLDPTTLKPGPRIEAPLGSASGADLSADGRTAVVAWSTPSAPPDLLLVDLASGRVRPGRVEDRPSLAKLKLVKPALQRVTSFDGTQVPVIVYLPADAKPGHKLPAIVNVHGGPASSYKVRWNPSVLFWVAHGIAVVEPNVRGSTGFGRAYEQGDDGPKRMNAVKDLESIGRWTAAQPWADPTRLIVAGGSYGGYMTLMGVTHQKDLWKAGINVFGVYDWRTFMKTTSGVIREIFQKEIGPESDQAFLASISPAAKVDEIVAPLFVYAGANDPRVPRSESDAIVRSLRTRKVPVEYMVADNEGHSLAHKTNHAEYLARSLRFLETHLKVGNGAAGKSASVAK